MNKTGHSFNSASATWEDHRAAFFDAIENSDTQTIETILKKYPEATAWQNAQGQRPLHLAFEKRDLDTFLRLLDKGASPDQTSASIGLWAFLDSQGDTSILKSVVKKGEKSFIIPLLQRGASTRLVSGSLAPKKMRYEIDDLLKRADIIKAEYEAEKTASKPASTESKHASSASADKGGLEQASDIEVLSPIKVKNRTAQPSG